MERALYIPIKKIFSIALSTLVISCGGGGDAGSENTTSSQENNIPTLSKIPDVQSYMNTKSTIELSGSDADGDSLSYSASADNDNLVIGIAGNELTITPNSSFFGATLVTVTVSDGKASSLAQKFTLEVIKVNPMPSVNSNSVPTPPMLPKL